MPNLRSKIIRLAASMPKGSQEREALLDLVAAKRMDRSKAQGWVEGKIRYLTNKQMPEDRMISATAQELSRIADGFIGFWSSKASEYDQDAKDFRAQGLADHSANASKLAASMRERVSRWKEVRNAVSNQYGELMQALGLAKQVLR